ncbi:MAG: ABC transporter C-terminal domain-containing protein, partial [Acutalibacteraceae bacterium]|nr:ABC transporter C-terminal domain-containing protein [Acutalibacteraceae bacterium]
KLSSRILELSEKGITEYLGDYDYYIERKSLTDQSNPIIKEKAAPKVNDYKLRKEQAAEQRRLKTQLVKTEESIALLEKQIADVEKELSSQDVQSDYEKLIECTDKLRQMNEELEIKYILWEEIQEKIEE